MKLYHYHRSSASYRVRIALAYKGLEHEQIPVSLLHNEHLQADYQNRVADPLVPHLELDHGHGLVQSMAIIEYLDEVHPNPPLMPPDALGRARVRALAQSVACEIHPLNNLRVLRYLVNRLGVTEQDKQLWYAHWVRQGLEAFEKQLSAVTGRFCHGDHPTMADCLLVPQVVNAQRFNVPLEGLERVMAVFEACMALPAFASTHPSAFVEPSAH